MRIAISALAGMSVTLSGAVVHADPGDARPPAPPPAGTAPTREVPPPVPSPFPPQGEGGAQDEIAGWHDGFFIRDRHDNFRFYPYTLVQADFYSSFGPGVSGVPAGDVGAGLKPRLSIRKARLGFDAELFKRWSITTQIEFGGQPLDNAGGTTETYAAKPGQPPTATTGRYGSVQAIGASASPADVFINYRVCACFNVEIGHFKVPFSLDNRSRDAYYPMVDRPIGIRGFTVPSQRDIGGMVWGVLGPDVFSYELAVIGGDGQNRPSVDARVDFVGRLFAHPFAGMGSSDWHKYTQIGLSMRHGDRDSTAVGYDMPALTTAQGFVLWKPTYTDSMSRLVHVIPSGAQNWIGGEARVRAGRFALQGEAYYTVNDTREAIDGYQLTNTERYGRLTSVGWYVQVSAWPYGDAFLTPDPGVYTPRHMDLTQQPKKLRPHGLEVLAVASGVNASYKGATRNGSTPDPNTPMSDVTAYQMSLGANYWYTKFVHFGVYYSAYLTPDSGTKNNQAVVPGNLTKLSDGSVNPAHVFHELSARLGVSF